MPHTVVVVCRAQRGRIGGTKARCAIRGIVVQCVIGIVVLIGCADSKPMYSKAELERHLGKPLGRVIRELRLEGRDSGVLEEPPGWICAFIWQLGEYEHIILSVKRDNIGDFAERADASHLDYLNAIVRAIDYACRGEVIEVFQVDGD